MFAYTLIFVTFSLFVIAAKKVGFLPFPTFLIFFLGVSQVMSVLDVQDIVPYDMHELYDYGGLRTNFTTVQLIYTIGAFIALLSLSGKMRALKSVDLTGTLRELLKKSTASRFRWTLIALLVCGTHFVLYLLVADWDWLWSYDTYLSLDFDPRWLAIFGYRFSDTVIKAAPAFSILSCLCLCSLFGTRNTILKLIAGTLTVFYFALLLSQHSRSAAFFPVLLAINIGLLGLKGRTVAIPGLLLIAALAFMGALIGRGTERHGLSALPETIVAPFLRSDPFFDLSQALMDSCQGIIVTAESLQLTADFDPLYKILAFSPLPSYIDDYSSIREESEHRLHEYVPMSGIGEAFHFGWLYVSLLFIGYIILIRLQTRIAPKNPAIFVLCNLLTTMSIYILLAYPLRNALRFYWITLALILATDFLARRKALRKKRQTSAQVSRRHDRMIHLSDLSSVNYPE